MTQPNDQERQVSTGAARFEAFVFLSTALHQAIGFSRVPCKLPMLHCSLALQLQTLSQVTPSRFETSEPRPDDPQPRSPPYVVVGRDVRSGVWGLTRSFFFVTRDWSSQGFEVCGSKNGDDAGDSDGDGRV